MRDILKEYIKTTIFSFALVVLINSLILYANHQTVMSLIFIFQIFLVCIIVNIVIFLIHYSDIKNRMIRDLFSIGSLSFIVIFATCIFSSKLINLPNIIINIIFLTIIYYAVLFMINNQERKDEQAINKILKSKRNL